MSNVVEPEGGVERGYSADIDSLALKAAGVLAGSSTENTRQLIAHLGFVSGVSFRDPDGLFAELESEGGWPIGMSSEPIYQWSFNGPNAEPGSFWEELLILLPSGRMAFLSSVSINGAMKPHGLSLINGSALSNWKERDLDMGFHDIAEVRRCLQWAVGEA